MRVYVLNVLSEKIHGLTPSGSMAGVVLILCSCRRCLQVTYTGSNLIREAWQYHASCVHAGTFAARCLVFALGFRFSITVWGTVQELPPRTVKRLLRGRPSRRMSG